MVKPSLPSASEADGGAEVYGLEELLALAGERLGEELSSRTVRLYATQGLIDRPGKEGRSAVYGRRHLLQLLLIRTLARRGLSLSAIAPLCVLADADLEQQLVEVASQGSSARSPSPPRQEALAYLQGLRSGAAPQAAASLLPLLGSPLPPTASSPRSTTRSAGTREAASRWHRFSLSPGVELHINEAVAIPPAGSRRLSWLQHLAERLIEQLDDPPA